VGCGTDEPFLTTYSQGFDAFATSEWDQDMIAAIKLPSLHLYDLR
jgi:hypothetical protein